MPFRPANLVHTDEGSLAESTPSTMEDGSTEPGTRSSAGEHPLHTGRVAGSIPAASTTRFERHRDWIDALAPYGFKPPNGSFDRTPRCVSYLYFIEFRELVKVGLSLNVKQRVEAFRLGAPRGLILRGTRKVPRSLVRQVEQQTHALLKPWADGREWFKTTPKHAKEVAQPVVDRAWAAHAVMVEHDWFFNP